MDESGQFRRGTDVRKGPERPDPRGHHVRPRPARGQRNHRRKSAGVEGRGSLALLWLVPLAIVLLGGIGIPQATTYYVAREWSNPAAVVRRSIRLTLILAIILLIACGAGLVALGDIGGSYSSFDAALSVGLIIPFLALNLGIAVLLRLENYQGLQPEQDPGAAVLRHGGGDPPDYR
jgi:hypothetical protein